MIQVRPLSWPIEQGARFKEYTIYMSRNWTCINRLNKW